MQTIIVILISVLLNCAAQLFIKKGMIMVGEVTGGLQGFLSLLPAMASNLFLWVSVFCYALSMVLWLVVLSRVDVSYAYPFLSIGYILAAAVGYFVFHEAVSLTRVAGILVICIGVILISGS